MPNQLQSIHPYRSRGEWAFDDESTGLERELLVFGTDAIVDDLVRRHLPKELGQAIFQEKVGCTLIFSHQPFPGYHIKLKREEKDSGGTWYARQPDGARGWLCPALFLYFPAAPPALYARIQPLKVEDQA